MSTRGCVAIKMPNGKFCGVYNHFDSYPTGLGKELWDYLHQEGISLKQFAEDLLKYDDWRNFRNGGVCPYCGKVGKGQPHTIRGEILYPRIPYRFKNAEEMRQYYKQLPAWRDNEIERVIKKAVSIAENIKRTGYPDPEAKYHEHGELTDKITDKNADPLFIEWVYVIDTEKEVLEILTNRSVEGTDTSEHFVAGTFSLNGNEPDWEALERGAK